MIPARRVTSLKKTALVLAICLFTLLIVLPATYSVNNSTSNTVLMDRALRADGDPMPPFPPKPPGSYLNTLAADGDPMPPFPPKPPASYSNTFVADGDPMPPFPPKPPSELAA
jgi:hypothetical protein